MGIARVSCGVYPLMMHNVAMYRSRQAQPDNCRRLLSHVSSSIADYDLSYMCQT